MDKSQLRARRRGMNTAEMLQDMSDKELARNARRGGQMAIEEQDEFHKNNKPAPRPLPDPELDQ